MGASKTKAIKEYIKLGEVEGKIEIEIKGLPGKRNYIVRRTLFPDRTSEFKLDGTSSLPSSHQAGL